MGSTDTGLGGETDQAEARRIAARKAVADRKAQTMRDGRLTSMEAARQQARDAAGNAGTTNPIGEIGEEVHALTHTVFWLATELRALRIEVADRAALTQELGRPFRQEGEVEEALQRAGEDDQ